MNAVTSMNAPVNTSNTGFQSIPGFEKTDYAYYNGRIVWAGVHATTQHPRNVISPWQPTQILLNQNSLYEGALICKSLFATNQPLGKKANGLMLWFLKLDMPFPLNLSASRFDDIQRTLAVNDLPAFTTAAIRVLGLGNGLTPSGDDFVGGILLALVHSPNQAWVSDLPDAKQQIHLAAKNRTNVISAALLDDMMTGNSYSALHDLLIAFQSNDRKEIHTNCLKLLSIGASSGSDMLAGLLLAITTQHQSLQNHNKSLQH